MKIVFSVLHYQAVDMTKECINSILRIGDTKTEIVIVDNASSNNSGEDLCKLYEEYDNVHIVLNDQNLGFAKGNNIGYEYAKNQLDADMIVVMNNDVIIEQKDFIQNLVMEYSKHNSHILAPKIINLEGENQNPVRLKSITNRQFIWLIIYNMLLKVILKIPRVNNAVVSLLVEKSKIKKYNSNDKAYVIENIVPHGAMVIYTKQYIVNEDIAFVPRTFLFCEEDILFEYTKIKKYKTIYTPNIRVVHYEDVSIREINKKEIDRRRFIVKHKLDSLKALAKIKYLKKY